MKPEKRTEIVERVYWACGIASHRHQTEIVAQECIDKHLVQRRPHNRWDEYALGILLNELRAGATDDYLFEKYRVKDVCLLRRRANEFDDRRRGDIDFYLSEIVNCVKGKQHGQPPA